MLYGIQNSCLIRNAGKHYSRNAKLRGNICKSIDLLQFFTINQLKAPMTTDQPGTYTLRENPGLDVVPNFEVLEKYKQDEFLA